MYKTSYRWFGLLILLLIFSRCHTGNQQEGYHLEDLGKNVFVFSPEMDMGKIQYIVDSIFNLQTQQERKSEFNENRFALLFKPGQYKLNISVGYYTHVIGLGQSPDDVVITGAVQAVAPPSYNGSVLINFWRAVENLSIKPPADSANIWAVSQAAPMRRVHIKGNLKLHDNGAASGGFLANSKIDGLVDFGPQQQWFSRNCEWQRCSGGLWNIVSLGVSGAPKEDWPSKPYLSLEKTPFIREKPFWTIDHSGELLLEIPMLKKNTHGVNWNQRTVADSKQIPIADFFIAKPEKDDARSINSALARGKNILFSPGIYWLEESIEVTRPGTILTGIGMPSLVPKNGVPVIHVADVDDVTLSSIIVDAGLVQSSRLIEIGGPDSKMDHSLQPTFIYDVFVRVGGYHAGTTQSCVTINSNNVVVDHIWLWRADHGNGVGWEVNNAANGLTVNGDDVTIYGLFNEHFQGYQTIWNGESGKMYFYQCEMPYYVPSPEAWRHDGKNGFSAYKVSDHVENHDVWGMGIYNVFFKSPALVDCAVEAPHNMENRFRHITTIWLGGNEGSEVKSIINGKGSAVNRDNRKATW